MTYLLRWVSLLGLMFGGLAGCLDQNNGNNQPVDNPETGSDEPEVVLPRLSGPEMVVLSGGAFKMGSQENEAGREPDEALRIIQVADFSMGKYEVTRGEFRTFVEATGYKTDAEKNSGGVDGCWVDKGGQFGYLAGTSWKDPNFPQTDLHPVVCISWVDATNYAKWLSNETGKHFHLPTEAEWEYAARAGATSLYTFGDNPRQLCGWGNVADAKAKGVYEAFTVADCDDGYVYTAPVGEFAGNTWALHDMHGNVWEWSCSEQTERYEGREEACLSDKNIDKAPAFRGGSWLANPEDLRSANRGGAVLPVSRSFSVGFRVAQDRSL